MKVQLPITGKASGSSAGTIYQSYWGNTYARGFPRLFHYPDTPQQQACQASFFDIQRIWLPCYNQLKTYIKTMQRKNKNPFNLLTSAIYRIFNPYQIRKNDNLPSYFGLDKKNRVYPILTETKLSLNGNYWQLTFIQQRPHIEIAEDFKNMHVLLFNKTSISMYYVIESWDGSLQLVEIENTNNWLFDDEIEVYVALSSPNWLGNFNRQKL